MLFPLRLIFLFILIQSIISCAQTPLAKACIQNDLAYYSDYLASHYKNLFVNASNGKFNSTIADFKIIADTLQGEKFIIELFKINALVADEHTRIELKFTERLAYRRLGS